jgi:hypothetical protein
MLEQLEACKGSHARIGVLEKQRDGLKKQAETLEGERDEAKTALGSKEQELAACSAASAEAEKRAKEATELAEGLKKELEDLKKLPAGKGDSAKLADAIELAHAWKATADRNKDEGEAAKKEAADLKATLETAKKQVTDLKARIAALETPKDAADPDRGLKHVAPDKTPDATAPDAKADQAMLSELEIKNKKLQEMLEDTRRILVEKEKEKEVSEGAIRQVLTDLVDLLGRTFECSSFTVEMRNGGRILKGTVAEDKHRDEARKMVLDSPLARLLGRPEIDVTAAGGRVCFVKTREPGWLMARSREKADQGATLFLRLSLDANVIQMLPRAADHGECERLGAVIKSLEPLEPRPSEPAVWVRGSNDAVTQCYASPEGWKLRYRVPDRDGKWPAWILLPDSQPGGGSARP